jgi:hypothetical protein
VAGDGTISADGITITGTTDPLAIAVTPDNSRVAVVDGGSSQQVKFYNNSTGVLIGSLGQAGGYSSSPTVANDKFYFSDSRDVESRAHPVNEPIRFGKSGYIAFESDGSYWVGDRHNCRIQHFSNTNTFIETIMTLPRSRSTRVDGNDSTRVFADYLEFSVDYSKPLAPRNDSWTFVKNWRYNMTDEYDTEYFRLKGVTTLGNGRTYAIQQSNTTAQWQVIELTSTGIRFTGLTYSNRVNIRPDGSLRRLTARSTGAATKLFKKNLTGFDRSNNPIWGTEAEIMSSPLATSGDPLYMGFVGWEDPNLDFTSSGLYIGYEGGVGAMSDPEFRSSKYHLGAIKDGNWLWKGAKNTSLNYTGNYPTNGDYDIYNNVVFPGGPIVIKERSIFWGYHGEFWKDAQANRWQHVYDNGLLLGMFGTDVHTTGPGIAPAEMAGNVLTAAIVKTGDDYYLYHCDESAHGGIHRWKISGLNTIQEQSILLASGVLPPTANAGADQSITLPTSTVSLTGSGTDADGIIASNVWSRVSGPTTFTLGSANSATTTLSNLVQGTYVFRLTVTDNSGATATDDVTVRVNAAPQPPVANAGSNITLTLPVNSTTLIGSGSDPDGTIASYSWNRVIGPATFTLGSANAATTTLSNLVQGTYTFRLTVTDNSGVTVTDDVTITVNAAPNQAPIANAGSNITLTLPADTTTLTGSGSDPDGTIASFVWSRVSGPATFTFGSANAVTTILSNLVQGAYIFRLTVTDNSGTAATDDVTVTVNAAPNLPPTADAGNNIVLTLPTNSATLTGSGSDADGTIAGYAWSRVSGPTTFTFGSANAATTTLSNLVQGTYTFRLTVTDNSGTIATDDVIVTVNSAPNQAPTANAGNNIVLTLPTNSATLTGSGADVDGTIASYAWSRVSGSTAFTLVSANAATTALNNLVQGTYTFRLTVTDNSSATATDDMTVIVNAAPVSNLAPIANAGSNIVLTLPASSATLTGSGTDADGTIFVYAWSRVSGPATFTFGSANAATTTLNNLVQGTYVFRLTVTDNSGATASDDITVTVNATPNQAPTANAGNNITLTLPTNSTTLTGNGTDADGTITSYSWSRVSGPTTFTLANATAATTGLSNLVQGTYTFRLTVTDNSGATDSDNMTVTVNAAPNQIPAANAGNNIVIILPVNATTLTGSGSDLDGTIASYAWSRVSGPTTFTFANASAATTALNNLVQGTYIFRLTVTDNNGSAATDDITVTVNAAPIPNQAPTARAGNDINMTLPANATTLNGNTSADADGIIVSYSWSRVSGPSTFTYTSAGSAATGLNNLVEGTYVFRLTVTDDDGATDTDNITVTVNPAPNQVPTAYAGNDIVRTLPTNSAILIGSGSDLDGTIASYVWSRVSGPTTFTLGSANAATTILSNLVQGTYVFRLTVTDNRGAAAADNVTVTVNVAAPTPNQLPVANAGPDQTITLPSNSATLYGNTSYDPDGTISSYNWQQISGPGTSTFSSTTASIITSNDLQEGNYIFRLIVKDNRNAADTATVNVTVVNNFWIYGPVALYPNPAYDIINIVLNSDSSGTVLFNIYDMQGRKVMPSIEVDKPRGFFTATINVSQLWAGTFTLEAITTRYSKLVSKFVKL